MAVNFDAAVIGAGAVGSACAYELARSGLRVALIEREASAGQGASRGTACLATAGHAERLANRQSLREAIHFLTDPAGPLVIRPSPSIAPWLARFAANAVRDGQARAGTAALREACVRSVELHRDWSRTIDTGLVERGVLNVWVTPAGAAERDRWASEHRAAGLEFELLDEHGLREAEPALLAGAVGAFYPRDAHLDSEQFCIRAATAAGSAGAEVMTGIEVFEIRPSAARVLLETTRGQISTENLVLAAGIDSSAFARAIASPLPMQGAKGYNVEFEGLGGTLSRPVFIVETRVVATPLANRLRLAGTMEFGTRPATVNRRRVEAIVRAGAENIRGVAGATASGIWRGRRPVTPDGLPVIGRSARRRRVLIATGHAQLGLTLAPLTARWIREMLTDGIEPPEAAPFSPGRFRV